MTVLSERPERVGRPVSTALAGDPAARLLAGSHPRHGAEPLGDHLARLGMLPGISCSAERRRDAIEALAVAGVAGRGGGEFPLAKKLALAAASPIRPLVVVNGAESEPASRKDRLLLELRPHLVLDGAAHEAALVGADRAVVYLEAGKLRAARSLERALGERAALGSDPSIEIVTVPPSYVAGESSSIVNALSGRLPLPTRRRQPAAAAGVEGRPTVVSNVETLAHLGLVARFGAAWFASAGSAVLPGSSLLTLAGEVGRPGQVVEVLRPVRAAELLRAHAGLEAPPQAVLVGGYAGRFVDGRAFWEAPVDRGLLARAGIPLGCGLLVIVPEHACGLETALRVLSYLASERAGQCGSCDHGLPALEADLSAVVAGRATRRAVSRLRDDGLGLVGQGACGLPDGTVALLESALDTFAADLAAHRRGRHCGRPGALGWLPLLAGSAGTAR